jgi:hypothetical protein
MPEAIASTKVLDRALSEASIRLAWYLKAHGGIPPAELAKLGGIATGLWPVAEAVEMRTEAENIKSYLLDICASRDT